MWRLFVGLIVAGLLLMTLEAKTWEYRITSPLFGTLGSVQIRENNTSQKGYRIVAEAKTHGIAATLTRHRHWQVLSEGKWKGLRRVPHHYSYQEEDKKKKKIHDYSIDPVHRKVEKSTREWKRGKLRKKERSKLPYYSDEDPATLLFNLLSHPQMLKSGRYRVVGAEKNGGYITVTVPDERNAASERSRLRVGKQEKIVYIVIPQKKKSSRKIVAAVSTDGELDAAYTVAVPVIGVLYMKRR
ncbi:DUF3108 domain-containing protein [Nitratifractor salsuginis]|uniref:DUF3108 domain-containing protein n=1 Tax=Nitratifractor salsuginis (strain DSM 16511 / JCM 12458 / E9I37-1) TaxID=749222 RepID=E6X1I5_NITSE|nr:DUF3108 domain-containing protein [Nitratifractor salsuginis]ADV45918.1 hypothetical protein Nitsa_0650 [Nitratifractor salsuginis DSM 16511]